MRCKCGGLITKLDKKPVFEGGCTGPEIIRHLGCMECDYRTKVKTNEVVEEHLKHREECFKGWEGTGTFKTCTACGGEHEVKFFPRSRLCDCTADDILDYWCECGYGFYAICPVKGEELVIQEGIICGKVDARWARRTVRDNKRTGRVYNPNGFVPPDPFPGGPFGC
jgi:hypothetical protein